MPDHLRDFLSKLVNFNGNNLDPQLRKLCLICRSVLERPELLMIFEETLDFGSGIEKNLDLLFGLLENTTIIVITKTNSHLHLYKKVLLMDAGYLFSGGNLEQLLVNEQSFMFKYLRETDLRTLHNHLNYYGISMKSKSQSQIGKTGGISGIKQDDISKSGAISFGGKSPGEQTADGHSLRGDSMMTAKLPSERKIPTEIVRDLKLSTAPIEMQPDSATMPVQKQPSLFSNVSGASSGPFRLGQILREAFKINPIPAEVGSPKTDVKPENQKAAGTSLSAFAVQSPDDGLKRFPTISSRGQLENEEKSQQSMNKKQISALQFPSMTDKDLNMTDSPGLLEKLRDKETNSYQKAPRLLNFLGDKNKRSRLSLHPASSNNNIDYNIKSNAEITSQVHKPPIESKLMLSPPPERHFSELQRDLGVRIFPPIRACELSQITRNNKQEPNQEAQSKKPTEMYVLEEEVQITAKRRVVVSRVN